MGVCGFVSIGGRARQEEASTYLVLKVDWGVEVGNLGVDGLAEHLVLYIVDELAHLCKGR